MTWLLPIGLLGLIGVIALIVIYIIKPNYQQKRVSSTYVWRLSLKYKKKKLPVNRLQNIIQFICQVLVLTIAGLLIAQPVLAALESSDPNEKVIIIDSSASMLMLSDSDEKTRFERAVKDAETLAKAAFAEDSLVTVIVADASPSYLVRQIGSDGADALYAALNGLECTYGSADVGGALALAETILDGNNEAQVYFCTATNYLTSGKINIVPAADYNDWNAAILDSDAVLDENNHYVVNVDVGCYGRTEAVYVHVVIHDPNGKGQDVKIEVDKVEFFDPSDEEKTITFTTDDFGNYAVYSYDYIEVYISTETPDSFFEDDVFVIFGGKKPVINVQYASTLPNRYFSGVIRSLRQHLRGSWDIKISDVKDAEKMATEGFDFYIFEHTMPDVMPTDGVVLLVNPDVAPLGSELEVGVSHQTSSPDDPLAPGASHPIMDNIDVERISIALYNEVLSAPGYQELAYYNGNPVILCKEDQGQKVVVWAFDLNYSTAALTDFAFMMLNMFHYFIPSTITSNSFEIGDVVEFNGRGTNLVVVGGDINETFESAKGSIVVTTPGNYTVTQDPMQGDDLIIDEFYVHIPNIESNITKVVELPMLSYEKQLGIELRDLLLYFAIALVTFMVIERVIETKKKF